MNTKIQGMDLDPKIKNDKDTDYKLKGPDFNFDHRSQFQKDIDAQLKSPKGLDHKAKRDKDVDKKLDSPNFEHTLKFENNFRKVDIPD